MEQRLQFLSSYQKEEMSVADLCRAFGISRPTAYRWINRYNETGPEGLVDRIGPCWTQLRIMRRQIGERWPICR
jgi:transposase